MACWRRGAQPTCDYVQLDLLVAAREPVLDERIQQRERILVERPQVGLGHVRLCVDNGERYLAQRPRLGGAAAQS